MDALELLKQMHVEAKAGFANIEAAPPTERGALWAKLEPDLSLHERLEEEFVYDPVAQEAGATDPVLGRWESEHEAQVREADAVMASIDGLEPTDQQWLIQVTQLHQTLEGHIAHEEQDIWPRIRSAWGDDRLAEVGNAMDAERAAGQEQNRA